jgi:glycosyltransferase involved in cell wall biosynthesis
MPLRIGVNALYLVPGGVGGTEIYLRNLLKALASIDRSNTYWVFTNRETDPELVPASSNFIRIPQLVAASIRPFRLIWEQTILPLSALHLGLNCMLNPGFTAPAIAPCPNVTVFHDLQHKRHPEHFRWFDKPAWDFFLWLAVKRSRGLIADSEQTKSDLMRYYGIDANRVEVALLGVEDEFFSLAEWRGPIQPYLLCVSTLHPHKNIERLIRVFARFHQEKPEYRLIIAGMRGFHTAAIERLISSMKLEGTVELTGWLARSQLYDLYRHAAAIVYPSTFEGFGLPVVEAMAAGIPLACSDIEPLRSTVGDAAFTFHPDDDEGMLHAIRQVVHDRSLVESARQRARQFTWARCAERTLAAIYKATGFSEGGPRVESSRRSSSRGTSQ